MRYVVEDYETYSEADIKEIGSLQYARHRAQTSIASATASLRTAFAVRSKLGCLENRSRRTSSRWPPTKQHR